MQIADVDKDQLLERAKSALESARRENGGSTPAIDDLIDAAEALVNAAWLANVVELEVGKHYIIPMPASTPQNEVKELTDSLTLAGISFTIKTNHGSRL